MISLFTFLQKILNRVAPHFGTKTFETNIPFELITLIRRKCSMTSFRLKTSSRASVKTSKMRKSGCSLRGRRTLLGQLKYVFLIGKDSLYHRLAIVSTATQTEKKMLFFARF